MGTLSTIPGCFYWFNSLGIEYRQSNGNSNHHWYLFSNCSLLFYFKFRKRHKGVNRELNQV